MTGEDGFSLDARLAADSIGVVELSLCSLRLMRDATYPWLILVPRRAGASEILDLDEAERTLLMAEIAAAGAVLRRVTACHKLNVAALGNVVPQLHVHVVARLRGDPAWPGPVWGHGPATAYPPGEEEARAEALRRLLER